MCSGLTDSNKVYIEQLPVKSCYLAVGVGVAGGGKKVGTHSKGSGQVVIQSICLSVCLVAPVMHSKS